MVDPDCCFNGGRKSDPGGVGSDLRPRGGVAAIGRFTAVDGLCCSGMGKERAGIMVGRIGGTVE